ncbi:uncharacterized protein [Parasteatoda tepidariorum]|uniref:uncharacterized protein n=1 Tax=Parasteatoda tepidariorum TaxID=114398 RepID=UPI001C719B8E|nr:flavin-containing monooxygenase FMO GS-OX-like 2 [Parasteatoda tepidariorum]
MASIKARLKVVVIGAGAAGLCALRHLLADPEHFDVDIFEKKHFVGGIWNYSDKVGLDENTLTIESSIYKNLITNIPKETMAFPDFPFPHYGGLSYIHHTQVLQYLRDYAEYFDLYKHIKFHKMVEHVKPLTCLGGKVEWRVTYSDVLTKEKEDKMYDAVMVCNGCQNVPNVPEIPGLNDFQGILMHSHAYRENAPFKDLKVVILGASFSGVDISLEIANVAKMVIWSHNSKPKTCPLPKNIIQLKGIDHVNKTSVTLIDGQTQECDAIILCTGYLVNYPFLDPSCSLQVQDQRVTPLYFHTFLIDYPTLAILAVTKYVLPFPVFDQQVRVFLKFLKGDVTFPSPDEMREEEEKDFKRRLDIGLKPSHAHDFLNDRLWKFDDEFCKLGQIAPTPNSIRNLVNEVMKEMNENLMHFKEKKYRVVDSETFLQVD